MSDPDNLPALRGEVLPAPRDPIADRPLPARPIADLWEAFIAGKAGKTATAYRKDLADFARFLGVAGPGEACRALCSLSPGDANRTVYEYRVHLETRTRTVRGEKMRLAPATVARRLAALRSVVKLARSFGSITWGIEVPAPKVEPYRDTRGPGDDGWRKLLNFMRHGLPDTPLHRRDLAMLRLLHDNGLRRKEVRGLDLADVDWDAPAVLIIGKGKVDKVPITINVPTLAALSSWVAVRGTWEGPLFVRLDHAGPAVVKGRPAGDGDRLSEDYLATRVAELGRRAGLNRRTLPHGLRHQGITRALDMTGGDVRSVQKFSRHAKLDTLMRYDDARRDDAGRIARLLGEDA